MPELWDNYKKKLGDTRPWDLLNPNKPRTPEELQEERLSICIECPRLFQPSKQCMECGCFMELKTRLAEAACPLGKWHAVPR